MLNIFDPSNYYLNEYAIPVFFSAVTMVVLGLSIFLKNPHKFRNRAFLFHMMTFAVWLFSEALGICAKDPSLNMFFMKYFSVNAGFFIPCGTFLFCLTWNEEIRKKNMKAFWVIFAITCVMVGLNLFPNLVIVGTAKHFFGYIPYFDTLGKLFLIPWAFIAVLSFRNLVISKKLETNPKIKEKIKIIIIACCIGYSGSIEWLPIIFPKAYMMYAMGYINMFFYAFFLFFMIIETDLMNTDNLKAQKTKKLFTD
ncbi:MAG: histidine kinase N-terminal 7TM domain-containing protein [archaeon]